MKQDHVRDWMTKEVITIGPETSLSEAHKLMTDNNIRRLPVVNEKGHLVGIITLGDVRGAEPSQATSLSIWELNYLLATLEVEKIMTHSPITVPPDATIGNAARIMLENKVSGLPVVNDKGKVTGIITESDIFRMLVTHELEEAQPL